MNCRTVRAACDKGYGDTPGTIPFEIGDNVEIVVGEEGKRPQLDSGFERNVCFMKTLHFNRPEDWLEFNPVVLYNFYIIIYVTSQCFGEFAIRDGQNLDCLL